jgi:hypothetical protein
VDAVDPGQRSQVRAIAADERDLRLVHVFELQDGSVQPRLRSLAGQTVLAEASGL